MYSFPDDTRRAFEALPVPMAYYQAEGDNVFPLLVTDGLCRMMHRDRNALLDMLKVAMFECVHPDDAGRLWTIALKFAKKEGIYDVFYRACYDGTDEYRHFHTVGRFQTMEDGSEIAVVVYSDITAAIDEAQHLDFDFMMMHHDRFYSDPVTDLPNGNFLHEFADEKVKRLRYEKKQPMFLYVNVLSMRSYNNQYGTSKGDDLLRLVADELKPRFPDAIVARLIDDKFAIVTEFLDDAHLSACINGADQAIRKRAEGSTIGIQVGVCLYEDGMLTTVALDHAKHVFRQIGSDLNIIYDYYSRATESEYLVQHYIVENFDRALEEGWIQIYYQVLQRTRTGKAAALEALARWVDPVRGMITPNIFIPVLEEHHLLYKLDLYMAEQVCRELPLRRDAGLSLQPVSINISAQDFDHVDMAGELNRILDRHDIGQYGLTRHDFILEITEQAISLASDKFRKQLKRLRESGYRLWIDDFGSGYSSLNVFSQYEFDLVKFDLELLRHLDENNGANRLIMKTITEMCDELGVLTLAEGVENRAHMDFLLEIGVELAQGFYLYRPESLASIRNRLEKGDRMVVCETREERHQWLAEWQQRRQRRHEQCK